MKPFAIVVAGALAIGIGANTVAFSVVHALLPRPLPFAAPERLVEVQLTRTSGDPRMPEPGGSIESVGWSKARGFRVTNRDGSLKREFGFAVSPGLLPALGVTPLLGSLASNGPSVWLGYDYWRRTSGSPHIVGQTLIVDGSVWTIAGVMPPAFGMQVRDGSVPITQASDRARRPRSGC